MILNLNSYFQILPPYF